MLADVHVLLPLQDQEPCCRDSKPQAPGTTSPKIRKHPSATWYKALACEQTTGYDSCSSHFTVSSPSANGSGCFHRKITSHPPAKFFTAHWNICLPESSSLACHCFLSHTGGPYQLLCRGCTEFKCTSEVGTFNTQQPVDTKSWPLTQLPQSPLDSVAGLEGTM